MRTPEQVNRIVNKLCKWRRFFCGWQLGTRLENDPEAKAISNHRELSILLRIEVSALAALCIEKDVFTPEEFTNAVGREAEFLDANYQRSYPGFKSSDSGMVMTMPACADTMRVMNFKP